MQEKILIDAPYEKCELYGIESLSEIELLSIILRTGTKEFNVLELSRKILNDFESIDSFRFLQEISLNELRKIKGIGRVKAIELKAVGEIAKRINKPLTSKKIKIVSSLDVINLVSEIRFEKREILKLIILNTKNIVIKIKTIATGNINAILIDPKQIFSEVIKMEAPKMILVHNHPSGDPTPSRQDIQINEKLKQCAKMFEIELLDHIIIGDGDYVSITRR